MRITCIQMDMAFARPDENFVQAEALIRRAVREEKPDVILLPELWDTGFFPREGFEGLCDPNANRTKAMLGPLARELNVNLVGGSIALQENGRAKNTALVFDRQGDCIARYDKIHLFTPLGEHNFFEPGDSLCTFHLDGVPCGLIICYDLRFPELTRSLALMGIELLFAPAQWAQERVPHLELLCAARAVENQMYVACCNSCGSDDRGTRFGGHSSVTGPWGEDCGRAGAEPCLLTAQCDLSKIKEIRTATNVFRDRRPTVYRLD